MASNNSSTTVPAKASEVYDTAKRCFLDVARMLENRHSPQVFTDDCNVVYVPMPSGTPYKSVRDFIHQSLEGLETQLNWQSEWKEARGKSDDGYFILLYRVGAFTSEEAAVTFALTEELKQLKYVKADLGDQ